MGTSLELEHPLSFFGGVKPSLPGLLQSIRGRFVAQPTPPEVSPIQETDIEDGIKAIVYEGLIAELRAFGDRDHELMSGRADLQRPTFLHYSGVREYTQQHDRLFAQHLPNEYKTSAGLFTSAELRWSQGLRLARQLDEELDFGSPAKGGIIDYRAKSLFGLWEKTAVRYQLDPDEVFDAIGIRITVKDHGSARRTKERILLKHALMPPYQFRRMGRVHEPLVDTLDTPNDSDFALIRMTLVDDEVGPYEVQIQTMEDYVKWRKGEKAILLSLAASPKYGFVLEP